MVVVCRRALACAAVCRSGPDERSGDGTEITWTSQARLVPVGPTVRQSRLVSCLP